MPRINANPNAENEARVRKIYRRLSQQWGPQHWWPAETPFEVTVGAILTQNTSWTNVERVLQKLRQANVLGVESLRLLPLGDLEQLVRSSGYYRQKARKLKLFATFVHERYGGSFERMFVVPTERLRAELLSLNGIGHETADAILLYAGKHEVFVVDTYARRVLQRHGLMHFTAKYDEVRMLVENALRNENAPKTAGYTASKSFPLTMVIHQPSPMSQMQGSTLSQVYNEMHGLFVQIGKHYCHKASPDCRRCPLGNLLPITIESGKA